MLLLLLLLLRLRLLLLLLLLLLLWLPAAAGLRSAAGLPSVRAGLPM